MTGEQPADRALETIRRAIEEAATIIEEMSDPQEAFEQADKLADGIRKLHNELAMKAQRRQVKRIWESEEMSLAQLAKRTSRGSRQRAYQLLQAALERKDQEP